VRLFLRREMITELVRQAGLGLRAQRTPHAGAIGATAGGGPGVCAGGSAPDPAKNGCQCGSWVDGSRFEATSRACQSPQRPGRWAPKKAAPTGRGSRRTGVTFGTLRHTRAGKGRLCWFNRRRAPHSAAQSDAANPNGRPGQFQPHIPLAHPPATLPPHVPEEQEETSALWLEP